MREILFKAKRIDNGEWVEGYFVKKCKDNLSSVIVAGVKTYYPEGWDIEAVDENTLCQFTELIDKNDNKIWENDICKYHNSEDEDGIAIIRKDYVKWIGGTLADVSITLLAYLQCSKEWEVIGNIFDNPELLESEEEE